MMGNQQFEKTVLEKHAKMKATSTCFVDMETKVATMGTEKGLLVKCNTELLTSATRKGDKSICTRDSFFATILPTYLEFDTQVAKKIELYHCKDFLSLFLLLMSYEEVFGEVMRTY